MLNQIDIVFFDMDHTLIDNDCDVSWKEFLIDEGLAPQSEQAENYRYWDLYSEGRLPVDEFMEFQLRQFTGRTLEEMTPLFERHWKERVMNRVYPQAIRAIADYRARGIHVAMLTATNEMVAGPVCRALGLDGLVATRLEVVSGLFTGRISGTYCIKEGKISRAEQYCENKGFSLDQSCYYGDSVSDIPMLKRAAQAVTINPGEELGSLARERGWRVESWALETKVDSLKTL